MSKSYKNNNREFTTLKNGYKLEVIRLNDVLTDINFVNEDELFICKDIIIQLEDKAASVIADNKTVALPYIGRLRKPLVKQEMNKQRKLLKLARQNMDDIDFKQYVKDTYYECVDKIASKDLKNKIRKRLIALNRKRYVEKYNLFGEFGANLWIESLLWLQPIEFNQEVQDVYDRRSEERRVG